ncbi:MAG: adenine nucleotide alpha hydrolase [Pseudomonadota bacterium]|nr:adenine nucleotide alpha hydrolase [Pseudomonadota bacterium]
MRSLLERVLRTIPRPAVAVSGGVDSVTLAALTSKITADAALFHAVSPAVPAEATARVKRLARERGWQLTVLCAGEFDDPDYRANPVNRCFYCKRNLYGTIRSHTDRPILSGANLDDLGEYRPGLDAARLHDVRHPFIEAGLTKHAVRELARDLALGEVAELPAAPCLSSRVETGIRIEAASLAFIHDVERAVAARIRPATVRCRIRAAAVVVELDPGTLARLSAAEARSLSSLIGAQPHRPADLPIRFEEYRNGSAFLTAGR